MHKHTHVRTHTLSMVPPTELASMADPYSFAVTPTPFDKRSTVKNLLEYQANVLTTRLHATSHTVR